MDNSSQDDRMESEETTENQNQPQPAPLPLIDYDAPPEVWVTDICRRLRERTTQPGELLSRILYAYRDNIQALSNRLHVPIPKLQEFINKWNERMGPRSYTAYLASTSAQQQPSTSTSGQQATRSSEEQPSTSFSTAQQQQPSTSDPSQEQLAAMKEPQLDSKPDSDEEEVDGNEDSEGESVASSAVSTGSSLDEDEPFNENDFIDVDDEDDDEEGAEDVQPKRRRATIRLTELFTENGIPIRSCFENKNPMQIKKGSKEDMIRQTAIDVIKKDMIKKGKDPGPDFELMDKHKKDLIPIIGRRIIPIGNTCTMEVVKGMTKKDRTLSVRVRMNGERPIKSTRAKNKGKIFVTKKLPKRLCKYNNCWKIAHEGLDYCHYHACLSNMKIIVSTLRDERNTDEDVMFTFCAKLVGGEDDEGVCVTRRAIRKGNKMKYKNKTYGESRPITKEGVPDINFQPIYSKLCFGPMEASEEKSRTALVTTLKKLTTTLFKNPKRISILTRMCGIPKTDKPKVIDAVREAGIEMSVEKLSANHQYKLPSYLKAAKDIKYSGKDNQLYSRRGEKAIYVGESERAAKAGRKVGVNYQPHEEYEEMTGDKLTATTDFILADPTQRLKAESLYILAAILGYLNNIPYADSKRVLEIINLEFKHSLFDGEDLDDLKSIFEYLFHHLLVFKKILSN